MHARVTTVQVTPGQDRRRHATRPRAGPAATESDGRIRGDGSPRQQPEREGAGRGLLGERGSAECHRPGGRPHPRGGSGGYRRNGSRGGEVRSLRVRSTLLGTDKRGDRDGRQGHGQPLGRRREAALGKNWHPVPAQEEVRAGLLSVPALLLALILTEIIDGTTHRWPPSTKRSRLSSVNG